MTTPNSTPTLRGAYDEFHGLQKVEPRPTSEVVTYSQTETSEFLGQSATLQYWNLT